MKHIRFVAAAIMAAIAVLAAGVALAPTDSALAHEGVHGYVTLDAPSPSFTNATAFAFHGDAGNHHDIDRKHCPTYWGCGWLDGTNSNLGPAVGHGTHASRGLHCGQHRYRHQGQAGWYGHREINHTC